MQRRVDRSDREARARVDARRDAEPDRLDLRRAKLVDGLDERVQERLLRPDRRRRARSGPRAVPVGSTMPARIFVPPRSIPITRPPVTSAGTLLRRMAPGREALPRLPRRARQGQGACRPGERARRSRGANRRPRLGGERLRRFFRPRRPGRHSWKPVVLLTLVVVIVLVVAWGIAGFLAFQNGVAAANKRFAQEPGAQAALAKSNGFLLTHATTILLLGTDSSTAAGRSGDRHADSIMIVRTDPSHHQLAYLSIPRDLLVSVPGRRQHEDQRLLPGRRRGARDQDGGELHGHPDRSRRDRRLQQLQGPDRRRGRCHGQRAGDDPLEPLRLPLPDAGAVPPVEGLAVQARYPAHERRAGTDLLAHPREPAQPGRERPHPRRAPAGRRAGRRPRS